MVSMLAFICTVPTFVVVCYTDRYVGLGMSLSTKLLEIFYILFLFIFLKLYIIFKPVSSFQELGFICRQLF